MSDTDDTADLSDFGVPEVQPPVVQRKSIRNSPTTGKIAGFVGREVNRGNDTMVYTTLRSSRHFYYEGDGWAISDSILDTIEDLGVSRILIHDGTDDRSDVFEYQARAYYDSEKQVHEQDLDDPTDPQRYTKKDNYLYKWEGHAARLFVDDFGAAVDRIKSGSGKRDWRA